MSQDGAREILSGLFTAVCIFAAICVVIAGIIFHAGISIDMTDLKYCGVKDFGFQQFLWMIVLIVPPLAFLLLRASLFDGGPLPLLVMLALFAGIYAVDIWWVKNKRGYWSKDIYPTEFCEFARTILPNATR